MDEKKYWVALSTNLKIGARTFSKLYKRFKKLSRVWDARYNDLLMAGIKREQVSAIKEVISKKDPDKELEKLKKYNIDVLIYPDKEYPKILKEIADPPGVLYIKGEFKPQDEIALAVVGSRKYTSYGERVVDSLVEPIAKKLTIVSGLALGIDALAHKSALSSGGRTIAVLGCGLDQVYPVTNIKLSDQILDGRGAIISEYPLGTPSLKHNFPVRNRIIAGLSLGTLVIEAAQNSGSLLTAKAAIDYNREVFAIPGSIFSENSVGPMRLLKMGAKVVTSYEDILEELAIEEKSISVKLRQIIPDSKEEEILLKLLKKPAIIDHLIRESKLEPGVVNSTLIMLEMKGKVTNLGGGSFVIKGVLK